jgi:hypothetical protein
LVTSEGLETSASATTGRYNDDDVYHDECKDNPMTMIVASRLRPLQ